MTTIMKALMQVALGSVAFTSYSAGALAETYPSGPVEIIVGFQPAGVVDNVGRALAASLSQTTGGNFVVSNRSGANGMIGAQAVANARPDGYTLGFAAMTSIANAEYNVANPPYVAADFQYICKVFETVLAIVVPEQSPYHSLQSLIDDIKSKPGKLSYGNFGANSLTHMVIANIEKRLGLDVVGVPFRGEAPMQIEMLAGRIDFGVGTVAGSRGKPVRVLAVVSAQRAPSLPDVPTLEETGFPAVPPPAVGLIGPRNLPVAMAERVGRFCNEAVHSTQFQNDMDRMNETLRYQNEAAFTKDALAFVNYQVSLAKLLGIEPQ